MDTLFLLITTAFPKAGLQLAGLPLTLNILLMIYVFWRSPNSAVLFVQRFRGFGMCYFAMLGFAAVILILKYGEGVQAFNLAQLIVLLISPFAGVCIQRINPDTACKVIILAVLLVNCYAIIEFFFGITKTAIPGLTYTYGQSLETKMIGYSLKDGIESANKMPSTYQNGNSYGIFDVLALGYLLAVNPALQVLWSRLRTVAIVINIIGLLLCGSRSILLPFFVVSMVLFYQFLRHNVPKQSQSLVLVSSVLGLCFFVVVLVIQGEILDQFINRFVVQTVNDPTAAGRTSQWNTALDEIGSVTDRSELVRIFFFGKSADVDISGGEGLPALLIGQGVPFTFLFFWGLILVLVHCWKQTEQRVIALMLGCVVFAFLVDTSYYYPPNVMNYFIFAALAQTVQQQTTHS